MTGSSVSGGRGQCRSSEITHHSGFVPASSRKGQWPCDKKSLAKAVRSVPQGHASPPGSLPELCLGAKGTIICHHFG